MRGRPAIAIAVVTFLLSQIIIYVVPVEAQTSYYKVFLRSRAEDGTWSDRGEMTLAQYGKVNLPWEIFERSGYQTSVDASNPVVDGMRYSFDRWEASGGISISSQYEPRTTMTVNGEGTLTFVAIRPQISLNISPSSTSVKPGDKATYTATVTATSLARNDQITVTFQGSDLPSGVSFTAYPTDVTLRPSSKTGTVQVWLGTNKDTPAGLHSVTVKAIVHNNDAIQTSKQVGLDVESEACPPSCADLVVSDISWSPSSPDEGDSVEFTYTERNQGDADAPPHIIGFSIDASSGFMQDEAPALGAGDSQTRTFQQRWTYPGGGHEILVRTDIYQQVTESNEDNNGLTKKLGQKDTVSTSLTLKISPSEIPENTPATVTLSGKLVREDTDDGFSGKPVKLEGPGKMLTVTTASDGSFSYPLSVGPYSKGTYEFVASFAAEETYTAFFKSSSDSAKLKVSLNTVGTDLSVEVCPYVGSSPDCNLSSVSAGSDVKLLISGQVVREDNYDIGQVTVNLEWSGRSMSVLTDNGGRFAVTTTVNLSAGSQRFEAYFAGSSDLEDSSDHDTLKFEGSAESFDFSIRLGKNSAVIKQGESITIPIEIELESGESQSVALSCSGIPSSEATCKISPSIVDPSDDAVLTISTGTGTTSKKYSATIVGTGGGLARKASFELEVQAIPLVENPVTTVGASLDLQICPTSGNGHDCSLSSIDADIAKEVAIKVRLTRQDSGSGLSGKSVRLEWPGGSKDVKTSSNGEYTNIVKLSLSEGTHTFYATFPGDTEFKEAGDSRILSVLGETVVEKPGATIISLRTDARNYRASETVNVDYVVKNTGDKSLRLLVVVDIKAPDDAYAYDSNVEGENQERTIDVGKQSSGRFTWVIPADAKEGDYRVESSVREFQEWDTVYHCLCGVAGPVFTIGKDEDLPPSANIEISPSNPDTSSKVSLVLQADDDDQVNSVELYINGKKVKSWEKGGKLTYEAGFLAAGEYTYYAVVTDSGNNVISTSIRGFYVHESTAETTPQGSTIYGYAKYANRPLKDVQVNLLLDGKMIDSRYADGNGRYFFDGVYVLSNGMITFNTYSVEVVLTDEQNRFIVVDDTTDRKVVVRGIDFTLNPVVTSNRAPDMSFDEKHEAEAALVYANTVTAADFYGDLGVRFENKDALEVRIYDYRTYYNTGYVNFLSRILNDQDRYISIKDTDSQVDSPSAPKNREWHEFSHYAMDLLYGSDLMTFPLRHGDQNICEDLNYISPIDMHEEHPEVDCNHHGYLNHDSGDSWLEGFAVFMPLVIADKLGEENVSIYTVDGTNVDIEGIMIETSKRTIYREWSAGDGYEGEAFTVAGILWDLYDDASTSDSTPGSDDDIVSLDLDEIISLISDATGFPEYYDNDGKWVGDNNNTQQRHIYYMKDLYDALMRSGMLDSSMIDDIFNAHAAPNGISFSSSEQRR